MEFSALPQGEETRPYCPVSVAKRRTVSIMKANPPTGVRHVQPIEPLSDRSSSIGRRNRDLGAMAEPPLRRTAAGLTRLDG